MAILFIFYSNIRPAQFKTEIRHYTSLGTYVCACVCLLCAYACLYVCALRPLVVSPAACSKANVYSFYSSQNTSLLIQTNVVLLLKEQFGVLKWDW